MGATGVKAFTPIQIKTHVKPTANIPSLTSSSNWLLSFILNQNNDLISMTEKKLEHSAQIQIFLCIAITM